MTHLAAFAAPHRDVWVRAARERYRSAIGDEQTRPRHIDPEGPVYEAPRLERYGTFRDLTLGGTPSKTAVGNDLIPGVGIDCDLNAPPGDPLSCGGGSGSVVRS